MNLGKTTLALAGAASLLYATAAPAQHRCADAVARPAKIERLRRGLADALGLRWAHWSVIREGTTWAISVDGLNAKDFKRTVETVLEMKELVEQGTQGKIRGFGAYDSAEAGARSAVWGVLGAAAIAASFGLAEDVGPVVIRFLQGVAALGAYRTLRWWRTMDDALAREQGLPESNLWGALGPLQSPLQYWLKRYALDGHLNLVLYLARQGAEAVRIDFGTPTVPGNRPR